MEPTYSDAWFETFEPVELRAIGEELGLTCEAVCADYDPTAAPTGEAARMQLVLRRP